MRYQTALLAAACGVFAVGGCSSGPKLTTTPSTEVDLSGRWEIDTTLSDNPEEVFQSAMAVAAVERGMGNGGGAMSRGGGMTDEKRGKMRARRGNSGGGKSGGGRAQVDGSPGARMFLQSSDWLVIDQSANRLTVSFGESGNRNFPIGMTQTNVGAAGKIETESGWEGTEFVAISEGERGLTVTERFVLSEDGLHLVLVTEIEAKAFDDPVTIRRVYNPTTS